MVALELEQDFLDDIFLKKMVEIVDIQFVLLHEIHPEIN